MELKHAAELQPFILPRVRRTGNILGRGSFGVVEELMFDHAPCAGKILHEALLNSRDVGVHQLIKKFERECKLMKEIRHPNIVQFFGICFFDDCKSPVIVMELLTNNVEHWLLSKQDLPLSLKLGILRDTANGLNYLHSHNPKIIHRDLTARNVLLTKSMRAKIADFGNSYIAPPHHLVKAMTEVPGTISYMPPEAFQPTRPYSEKLDMFSFGHLALYIILEEEPYHELLPSTIPDKRRPNSVIGLSEIERREKYLKKLFVTFDKSHEIPSLIHQCLQNDPDSRPVAADVIETFEKMLKTHCDDYVMFQDFDRYEIAEKLRKARFDHSERYDKEKKILEVKERVMSGQKFFLKLYRKKVGMFRREVMKWKEYIFCYKSGQFQYFGNPQKPPLQVVDSSAVESVEAVEGSQFVFQVQFKGNCQWILKAELEDDALGWVEAIKAMIAEQAAPPAMSPPPPPNTQIEDDIDHSYEHISNFKNNYEEINVHSLNPPTSYAETEAQATSKKKPVKKQGHSKWAKTSERNEPEHKIKEELQKVAVAPLSIPTIETAPPPPPLDIVEERVDYREHDRKKDQHLKVGSSALTLQHPEKRLSSQLSEEQLSMLLSLIKAIPAVQLSPARLKSVTDEYIEAENTYEIIPDSPSHLYHNVPDISSSPKHFYYNIDDKPPLPPKPVPKPRRQGVHVSKPASSSSVASLDMILKKSSEVSTDLLVLHDDEEDDESCYEEANIGHRPEWAKASMTVVTRADLDIENEMLYLLTLDPTQLHHHEAFASGQFGNVYRAILDISKTESIRVAIKAVKHESPKEKENFVREMCVMSKMLHPNIVRLYGLVLKENLIVLEYMHHGDLGTFLKNNDRPVSKLIMYMMDIGLGMHHITSLGLVHRDLAARNVLVSHNETCKIADFGMVRKLEDGYYALSATSKIPIRWCAPECLKTRKFYPASDVWSYGVVLREMAFPNDVPYKEYYDYEVAVRIMEGEKMEVPSCYPDTVQKIVTACWRFKPGKRPSFQYITMLLTKQTFNS